MEDGEFNFGGGGGKDEMTMEQKGEIISELTLELNIYMFVVNTMYSFH